MEYSTSLSTTNNASTPAGESFSLFGELSHRFIEATTQLSHRLSQSHALHTSNDMMHQTTTPSRDTQVPLTTFEAERDTLKHALQRQSITESSMFVQREGPSPFEA